jgi:hypothetical protein
MKRFQQLHPIPIFKQLFQPAGHLSTVSFVILALLWIAVLRMVAHPSTTFREGFGSNENIHMVNTNSLLSLQQNNANEISILIPAAMIIIAQLMLVVS